MIQAENSFKWELPIKPIDTPAGDKPNYYDVASNIIDKAVKYNATNTKDIHTLFLNLAESLKVIHKMPFDGKSTPEDIKSARASIKVELTNLISELNLLFDEMPDQETQDNIDVFKGIVETYFKG